MTTQNSTPYIFEFNELVDKLISEDKKNYIYRGQIKEYNMPLTPSLYRPTLKKLRNYNIEPKLTLRKVQNAIFVEQETQHNVMLSLKIKDFMKYQRRLHYIDYLLISLGYPFAQIFSQQAGLQSEGLDVTSDLMIALFFALKKYESGGYKNFNEDGYGVIYRWKLDSESMNIEDLKKKDFYTCPTYIQSDKIFNQFGECENFNEFVESLDIYKKEINWGYGFDIEKIRNNRPIELIKIPSYLKRKSRINTQSAGLLIPDQVLTKFWDSDYYTTNAKSPRNIDTQSNIVFLEDLSKSRNVEIFRFKHNKHNKNILNIKTEDIFPKSDITLALVKGWYQSFHIDLNNPFNNMVLQDPFIAKVFGLNRFEFPSVDPVNELIDYN